MTKDKYQVSVPDFIMHFYADVDRNSSEFNGLSREEFFGKIQLGYIFISIKHPESINMNRILSGSSANMDVSVRCNIDDLFDGDITLSSDAFTLRKNILLKSGEVYVVEYAGKRKQGTLFEGTYRAFDERTRKEFKFFSGNFHLSAGHFFEKYNKPN